jgi:hypothetical protein
VQAAGSLLQLLAPEEARWEFPSPAVVAELRELVSRAEVPAAAAQTREILTQLENS